MAHPPLSNPAELPSVVRLFPLTGALLLPRAILPLNTFEPRYLAMVSDAIASDQLIAMIQPKAAESAGKPSLYEVGTLGRVTRYQETGDGRILIALTGVARFRLRQELEVDTPYRQAEVDFSPYVSDMGAPQALAATARADLESNLRLFLNAQELSADWDAISAADDESLVNTLGSVCPLSPAERQLLLEGTDLSARASILSTLLAFAGQNTPARTLQ